MKRYLFVLVVFWLGCSPRMAAVDAGNSRQFPDSIKILSYNIHHCNPPSAGGLIDVDTIAGVINKLDPDVVALQEVDVNTKRSGGIDQAKLLGEKTGMKYHFFKAINHDGGAYGLAILSKFEVVSIKQYPLPTIPETKGEPRILATVELKGKTGNIIFACTHLDAQSNDQNRLLQVKEIASILGKSKLPVIIAGDLNAATGSAVINIFDQHFKRTCDNCAFTIPVTRPNKTIDFVGFAPSARFQVIAHEVVPERYASDHLPVNVTLKLK